MGWLRNLVRRMPEPGEPGGLGDLLELESEAKLVKRGMTSVFIFGLELRDQEPGIVDHCARVSVIASRLGRRLGISVADSYILQTAARLHEIGLVSVPAELLGKRHPLTDAELAIVRNHAAVGAEMVASMHHPRVARLVRTQYLNHDALQETLAPDDLLLAGILRVADVIAAVTWPRPYQDPLSPEQRVEVLESGAGVLFHPLAAQVGVEIAIRAVPVDPIPPRGA